MVDDEKHKSASPRRDYMREYMRRRRSQKLIPAPLSDLHGPPAPPNLPGTGRPSKVAILQAHLDHVLNLWSETGKELARATETDEMLNTIDSLMLENKHLRDEIKTLQEALKTCQSEPQEPQESLPPSASDLQPSPPDLPPSSDMQPLEPPQPGLVDPNRRPSPADDTPADWMM